MALTSVHPVRVFVCDDVKAFRDLIRFSLADGELTVVGEAADGEAAIDGIVATDPDVILLDLSMPRCDGLEAIPEIHRRAPRSKVVVLSGYSADPMAARAAEQGAVAYLEKGVDLDEVRETILRVARPR